LKKVARAREVQNCFLNCRRWTEVSNAIGFCLDEIEANILCANRATDFSHSLKRAGRGS
jgi:hypothetical protein